MAGRSTPSQAWEVREEVTEVSDLYATYAYDPKTASDEPRVILEDSDLIKISIADSDRDKRTGVLIRGASMTADSDRRRRHAGELVCGWLTERPRPKTV